MDTTKITSVTQSIQNGTADTSSIYWMYVSYALMLVVLVLLIMLLIKTSKKSQKTLDKETVKGDGMIDFGNIINSAFHAKSLYDSLIKRCHPDRFVGNEEFSAKATELSQQITESRHNHARLLELKEQAIKELKINI